VGCRSSPLSVEQKKFEKIFSAEDFYRGQAFFIITRRRPLGLCINELPRRKWRGIHYLYITLLRQGYGRIILLHRPYQAWIHSSEALCTILVYASIP